MDKLRKDARKAEERVASLFGGKLVPGSGSGVSAKGDVRTSVTLIEVKYTTRKSYSVKLDDWLKLENHAAVSGLSPVLSISFDVPGMYRGQESLVVLNETDYLILKGMAERYGA